MSILVIIYICHLKKTLKVDDFLLFLGGGGGWGGGLAPGSLNISNLSSETSGDFHKSPNQIFIT